MKRNPGTRWLAATAAVTGLCFSLGCAAGPAYDEGTQDWTVREAPLGGEALAQRQADLQRAFNDLVHFHATMTSLVDRRDRGSIALFDDFLSRYMGEYLDPMLRTRWQSVHPELAALDASLRFAKAELLIRMRYPRRVQEVIDDIERRFEGRPDLLVKYPLGRQGTLGEGLEVLKDRKWKG